MSTRSPSAGAPARTHAQAIELFRRPFAPGAIGFRAMTKVTRDGVPYGGALVAAYLNAQSVLQRLNHVVPGRWRMTFGPLDGDLLAAGAEPGQRAPRLYLVCQLIVTLPSRAGGEDVEAVYEDVGELEAGSLAGLKALYSDARKRAGVAAGIGAYLYTALEPVNLPLGEGARHVQCIRRSGKSDLLVISPETERWLREGYRARIATDVVVRDLGPMLCHGEPEHTMGQGDATDAAARADVETAAAEPPSAPEPVSTPVGGGNGRGDVVSVDFGRLGPPPGAA